MGEEKGPQVVHSKGEFHFALAGGAAELHCGEVAGHHCSVVHEHVHHEALGLHRVRKAANGRCRGQLQAHRPHIHLASGGLLARIGPLREQLLVLVDNAE